MSGDSTSNHQHYHGHRKRLRDKVITTDGNGLHDYEILEFLLFSSSLRSDVKPLAKELLAKFGSLSAVINAPADKLATLINSSALASLICSRQIIMRTLKYQAVQQPILDNMQALVDYCRTNFGFYQEERFHLIFLDNQLKLIATEEHAKGTLNHSQIYLREIIKTSLWHNAASLIIIHNHPNGKAQPSTDDITTTLHIKTALKTINVELIDHFIVNETEFYSFVQNGLF